MGDDNPNWAPAQPSPQHPSVNLPIGSQVTPYSSLLHTRRDLAPTSQNPVLVGGGDLEGPAGQCGEGLGEVKHTHLENEKEYQAS